VVVLQLFSHREGLQFSKGQGHQYNENQCLLITALFRIVSLRSQPAVGD
jgi:hypothetical protein